MHKTFLLSLFVVSWSSARPLIGQEVAEFFSQAQSLVAAHQYTSAVTVLESGLEKHPESSELLLQLGSLLVSLGHFERGDELLQTALGKSPFNAEALKDRGQARFRQGDLATAAELFRKSLWYRPDDAETHYRLAFTLFVKGDEKQALRYIRRAVEKDPLAGPYRRFYSLLLEVEGDSEQSFNQLRMAQKLDPVDPQTLYRLSRAENRRGNLGQALEYAELASLEDPENPLYVQELVKLYENVGDPDLANQARKQAQALESAYGSYLQALQLIREGNPEQAISTLERTVAEQPQFSTGALLLGDLYSRQGADERALEVYAQVLELDPSQLRAREESVWIHVRKGSLAAALDLLKGSEHEGLMQTFIEGYQHLLNDQWSEALDRFHRVQAAYPLTPGLLQLVSFCLAEMGRTEEALNHLAKAAEIQPTDARIESQRREIQFERAVNAMDRRDWMQAISILEGLLKQDSRNPLYLFRLGYSRQRIGELVEAVEAYRLGLAMDPGTTWARVNLGTSLYLLGRYSEALPEWERITRTDPRPEYLLQLGLCYSHLVRDPEAEVTFARALRGDPDKAELLYNLGITRLRLLKTDEAWKLIKRAARKGHVPAVELLRKARQ